ncbi:MAG: enoyl-CoA hydratase/isomerase family protein, partial [Bacteroidetes bacterium]|nr:enoyl-CoA hydratase/isomerase family protein [Bacteroidota bacterium]
MQKIKVNYSYNNSIAQIILDDGKGNVLDHIMMEEIRDVLISYKNNKELKLITFEGAGKHFSFGASVEEHRKEFAGAMLQGFHQLFFILRDLSIPTVAKISGQCLGGGLELALMCNQMFADTTAKLGQPEIILGVFPPPASILLPEKIGLSRAEDLLLTGRTISAAEGKEFGLLNRVFETKADLEAGTTEWIEQHIVEKSASSLRFAVKAARIKFNHVLSNFLPQLENIYVNQLMETPDANEGIDSF